MVICYRSLLAIFLSKSIYDFKYGIQMNSENLDKNHKVTVLDDLYLSWFPHLIVLSGDS